LVFADARKQQLELEAKDDGTADETDIQERSPSYQAATDNEDFDEQASNKKVEESSENTSLRSEKVKQKDDGTIPVHDVENLNELTVEVDKVLPYQCPYCKKFLSKLKFRRHIERVHKNNKFNCANCLQSFDSRKYLKEHICVVGISTSFELKREHLEKAPSHGDKRKKESVSGDKNSRNKNKKVGNF
jgi:hypothetical protein